MKIHFWTVHGSIPLNFNIDYCQYLSAYLCRLKCIYPLIFVYNHFSQENFTVSKTFLLSICLKHSSHRSHFQN